jgi:Holliday junction DNA helicase RuvB
MNDPIETAVERESPDSLDRNLRPQTWDEYVGQEKIKENLRILLTAAKGRGQSPEHVLFHGPPGLGKTTLAHLIAREIGGNLKVTSGPAIDKVGDLASILTNLNPGDILFIDEIHRLHKTIEEILYPAMESRVLDIIIGKGPSARTIQLDLPEFTLVAATTRLSLLSAPLRSRFSGGVHRLRYYSDNELATILQRSARILGIKAERSGLDEIAHRSRSTPRTANYFLKRSRDYAQVHEIDLNKATVNKTLELLEVDNRGLTNSDRRLLQTIIQNYGGGPVGLSTLSAALSEETGTIEDVYEPYLMQIGFLERTPRGRLVTQKAADHLGIPLDSSAQSKLL